MPPPVFLRFLRAYSTPSLRLCAIIPCTCMKFKGSFEYYTGYPKGGKRAIQKGRKSGSVLMSFITRRQYTRQAEQNKRAAKSRSLFSRKLDPSLVFLLPYQGCTCFSKFR